MMKKIIPLSKLNSVFNQRKLKFTLVVFLLTCLIACDSIEIKFENNVKGKNPKGLTGEYQLKIIEPDTFHFDTILIKRVIRSTYIIQNNKNDTLYYGEIRKKKNNYFLNQFDSKTGYWAINSFSIKNDSIHNFYSALFGYNNEIVKYFYFWEYEKAEKQGCTTYIINNNKRDTYDAFSALTEKSLGIFIQKNQNIERVFPTLTSSEAENSLDEIKISTFWKIYPNPFVSSINVEQSANKESFMRIMTMSGQIIREITIQEKNTTIDLSDLKPGVYLARFRNDKSKSTTIKIIKQV